MAKKKRLKAKEPVRLRFRELANGNKSIYLDTYVRGVRFTETIPDKLIPEIDEDSRTHNRNVLQKATAIKSQMVLDIMSRGMGLPKTLHRSKMPLLEWLRIYKSRKSKGYQEGIDSMLSHLKRYGANIKMKEADKDYIKGFIAYLRGTKLTSSSQESYIRFLRCAMNEAVRDEIIDENPFKHVESREKAAESKREFLTVDEIKLLMGTPIRNDEVKRAYLFACMCGLRISDIRRLKWGDIQKDGDTYTISVVMKKTRRPLYMKLSSSAMRWLPDRGTKSDESYIFTLPVKSTVNLNLKEWAKSAGINKTITFHTSRHTFATGELTAGADLYTVSSLLGHTQIRTTQIYAKIVNKKKEEAVDMWSKMFD